MLQDRPLGELEGDQGVVVGDDGGVLLGQGVGPEALGLQQDVQGAAAGQVLLVARLELLVKASRWARLALICS